MSLNDEQMARFEALSSKDGLDDAEMGELEQLDGLTRAAPVAAPQAPLPASVAPSLRGFTADDVSADVVATAKQSRNAGLKFAFDEARKVTEDDAAATVAIAKQLNVPFNTVRENLPAFRETAAAAQWDPERWATENPELSRLVTTNPHLGTLVMRSPEVGPIVKAWRKTLRWAEDLLQDAQSGTPEEIAAEQARAASFGVVAGEAEQLAEAATPLTPEQQADREKKRTEQDTPKPEQRRVDSISKQAEEKSGVGYLNMFLWQKAAEAKRGLDLSRKQADLMWAENGIKGDAAEIRAEIHDLKLEAIPRDLGGESGLLRDLAEGVAGAASTIDVGADALKGMGAAGAAGFVVGAVPTLVGTRSPGLALEAGLTAARVTGGKGASAAAFLSATQLETGSSYEALRSEVTDANRQLTPAEAMGGAVIQGIAKGALEFVSLGQSTKVLKQALPGSITGLLKSNPTFRALMGNVAKEYAKSVATEGVTEGLQDAIEQVGTYVQESMKDEALQVRAPLDTDRTASAVQGGVMGALLSGGVSSSFAIATTKTKDAQAEVADRQVGPLLDMANQAAVRAAPGEFAAMVAEEGGAKSLHVDAAAVVRFFQEKGDDGATANTQVAELLGPGAPAALLDAAASGGKLEVPMERVLSTWGASDIGKALKDDTTTDATGLTPRQRKEQSAEIEAQAEEIAQAEEAKATEQELLATRTVELEQQLIATGRSKQEAKAGAALVRAFMANFVADFDKAVSEVFPESPVSFDKGDETPAGREERVDQIKRTKPPISQVIDREGFEGMVKTAQKELLWSRIARRSSEQSVSFTDEAGWTYAVTPVRDGLGDAPAGTTWRMTQFDATGEPRGHSDRKSHAEAVKAAELNGALPDTATVAQARKATPEVRPDEFLTSRAETVDTATRAAELFVDPVSGLRTRRAWDESPHEGQVAVITSPDIKALNDDEKGGHDTANELLRLIGGVIGGIDSEAARSGTNFLIHAKSREELRSTLATIKAALPEGLTVEGATGLTVDEAFKKLDTSTDAKRDKGSLPKRGKTAFKLEDLGPTTFAAGKAATPNISPALMSRAESTKGEAFRQETYMDRDVPGVLSKTGFDALPDAAHVSAFDLKGLKLVNDTFGKVTGNEILRKFGETAKAIGGGDIAFAHLSGDEYAAKSNDRAKLVKFEQALRAALRDVRIDATLDGKPVVLRPDFRSGIGEKTYGAADRALNAAKRREAAGNDVQRTGGVSGEESGRQAGSPSGQLAGAEEVTRLAQDDGAIPKGYTELPAGRALQKAIRIFLNKSADITTVVHELGHAFLEQTFDLSERPDAPQRTKDTAAAALKALGVESRKEVKREQHEKFARAFEAYVMEGKAPSSALRKVFNQFQRWLTSIYRTLRNIPGNEISPELRQVFDAMLATEDQLEAMRKREGGSPTAKQLGITEEERVEQKAAEADDYTEGSMRAQLAAVKDALRVRESWWKTGLKKLSAAFEDEYEQLPAQRAARMLNEAQDLTPAEVAELAGYPSAEAMARDVAALKPRDAWVKAQADAEMRRLHPGILDDLARFRRMLTDGLRSATEQRLSREWKGLPKEALKRAAEKLAERREVTKLRPDRALAAQRSAANAKARAAAKGDITKTTEAAKTELLSHYLFHALRKAETEVEKLHDLAKSMTKVSARERLGKASPAYRDASDFILSALGVGEERPDLDASTIQAAVDQMNGDAVLIGDPEWLGPVLAAGEFSKLTVEQARHVHDALKQIKGAAAQRTTVMVDGRRIDRDEAKAAILAEMASILPEKPGQVSKHARTVTEKVKAGLNGIDGMLTSPVDMFREMTGDNQESMTWKVFVNPMRRAQILEADLMKERVKPIFDAFEAIPKDMRKTLGEGIDGAAMFPQHSPDFLPRRRYELLSMALNSGNESNLRVLLEGRNITPEQHKAALDTLTKEEIHWVNTIHKSLEALREPAFDLEERETGLRPRAIEAKPMALRNGTLEGGYFPLKAEPDSGRVGARQAGDEELASLFDPTFTRPGTTHGHLKGRTAKAVYVVALDPDVIRKHLQQVTHDLSFREAVKSAGSLIMDEDIMAEMRKRLGPEKAKEPLLWLKDIGGGRGYETNAVDGLFSFVKRNMSTALLSGISTAMSNWANLPAAVASTKLTGRRLSAAMYELARSPIDTRAQAMEKSGILRAMDSDLIAGLNKELTSFRAGKVTRGLEWTKEAGMAAMRTIDGIVSTAVFWGAYRQALAEGKDEATAVRWADDLLTQVQPGSSPVEKARILREKGYVGGLTMFYGYLSVAYRSQHRLAEPLRTQAFRNASPAEKAVMAGKVAGTLFGFYVAYAVLGEFGSGRGPEDGDRDEEEPESDALMWRNWFARKMLVAPLSTLPILPLSSLVESALLKKRANDRTDPFSGAVKTVWEGVGAVHEAIVNDGDGVAATKKSIRALGISTGLPARLVLPGAEYLWDITGGDREVPNAGRFVGGITYGERDGQGANLPAALGDGLERLAE